MDHEPQKGTTYQIQGPDEQGCVWLCDAKGPEHWCVNLGPVQQAAELMSEWLAQIDYDKRR